MGKAVDIGGIFIKYRDPKAMMEWFETALGLKPNDYGVLFAFNTGNAAPGFLQLGTFPETSTYFGKDSQQCMLNFRVEDLDGLLAHLQSLGVTICDEIEAYEYGRFLHIEDPEGNRIELWEAIDGPFEPETQVEMR